MPAASHPQAKFDPIPPDLDLHALVEKTPNFHWVLRVSAAQIRNIGPQEFERLVYLHVIRGGKPLVIEKWNNRLPKTLFSAEWLEGTYNKKREYHAVILRHLCCSLTTLTFCRGKCSRHCRANRHSNDHGPLPPINEAADEPVDPEQLSR